MLFLEKNLLKMNMLNQANIFRFHEKLRKEFRIASHLTKL